MKDQFRTEAIIRRNQARAETDEARRLVRRARSLGKGDEVKLYEALVQDFMKVEADRNRDLLALGILPGRDRL